MDPMEILGGKDWLELVMGARRVRCEKKQIVRRINIFPREYMRWSVKYLCFDYEQDGVEYRIRLALLITCKSGSASALVTRYSLLSIKNIYNRFVCGKAHIKFRHPPTLFEINPKPDQIRAMVEKLTGLSLSPF
jgi:hypothetical protein